MDVKCVWEDLFDVNQRKSLERGIFVGGIISIVLSLWISSSILITKLRIDRSYRNLVNFTLAACFHRIAGVVFRLSFITLTQGSDWQQISCKLAALVETFLAVFEIEWLTHVTIERYVVAKYTTNGWPINKNHYSLFTKLCIFFATLYSVLPLLGVGRYSYDLTCDSCTFDLVLPDSSWKYSVIALFFMRNVKPVIFMFLMLLWAHILERKYVCSEENTKLKDFTKNVTLVTIANLLCWTPIAVIKGVIVVSQAFTSTQPYIPASVSFIKWAMWIHWISPAITVLTLLATDGNIRNSMLNIFSKQEDKPKGDKEKKL